MQRGDPIAVTSRPDLDERAEVRVFVSNYNTVASVELCIRSMRRTADYPFQLSVGDSGSTDGSAELLRSLSRRGWLSLVEEKSRTTNDWIDYFLSVCEERFAVFVHSDMEFRRPGWLRQMVDVALERDPVMVYSEILPESSNYVEPFIDTPQLAELTRPVTGNVVHGLERPACWCFLANVEKARAVPQNFQDLRIESDEFPEGRVTYGTGGAFFAELKAQELPWELMPESFLEHYHHYGSMTWIWHASGLGWRLRLAKQRDRWLVRWRLFLSRLRDRLAVFTQ
jgi:glycosyltransferase involved in cell wall biosynthesis